MTTYGVDISGVNDVNGSLSLVSGRKGLVESVSRRLITPRGSLFYDPTYGLDLTRYLNISNPSISLIQHSIEQQCMLDERIDDADAEVTFDGATLRTEITLTDDAGPFNFTALVTSDGFTLEE